MLARSGSEPLNLGRWNWNLQLEEFGMGHSGDGRKSSDSVQFSADDVEDEYGKGLNYVQAQWLCVEEEKG